MALIQEAPVCPKSGAPPYVHPNTVRHRLHRIERHTGRSLAAVRDRIAAGLLVAKMDRLSRSVVDGAGLIEAARREGWALHFADLDIDTRTPAGEMSANIIISGSQYERRLINQRTRDALAARRARGERLGTMPKLPVHVTRQSRVVSV